MSSESSVGTVDLQKDEGILAESQAAAQNARDLHFVQRTRQADLRGNGAVHAGIVPVNQCHDLFDAAESQR